MGCTEAERSGAEKEAKKLVSSQPSNLPCPKEDFEPYPKSFSNRWKGLN